MQALIQEVIMTPQDAIAFFGSQKKLAAALNIYPQAIRHWTISGRIPVGRQYQLDAITYGKLKADREAA